ncbi:MAG: diguanylate cyclase, partial [Syntrophomonadaceae bacterium]|nr:diguanylate cyclase [Syntrophomonadaceae bacterium]
PGDFLGRWGGDEFVALMPQTDATGAMLLAEKFRQEILALALPHENSPVTDLVTISLGVATMTPRGAESSEELIKRADEALFTAKKAGRNRIVQRITGIASSISTH